MKQGTTILALIGIAIMSAGLTFAVAQNDATPDISAPLPKAGSFVNGHITVYLHDENGNLKAFRESDNLITNRGLEAIIMQTFGNWTSSGSPDGGQSGFNLTSNAAARAGAVKSMSIGIGGETAAMQHQADLIDRTGMSGCGNQTVQFSLSNGGANPHPNTGKKLVIVANATFQGSAGCAFNSVDEVGLFTRTASGGTGTGTMFARQTFSSVNIGANDQLTINWDIQFQDT